MSANVRTKERRNRDWKQPTSAEKEALFSPLLFSCKLEDATKGKQESGRRDLEKCRIKISAEKKDRLVTWKKSRKYPRGRPDIEFEF